MHAPGTKELLRKWPFNSRSMKINWITNYLSLSLIQDWYSPLVLARTIQRQIEFWSGLDPKSFPGRHLFLHWTSRRLLPPTGQLTFPISRAWFFSWNPIERNVSCCGFLPFCRSSYSFDLLSFESWKYPLRATLRNRKANTLIGSDLNWVNVALSNEQDIEAGDN